MRTINKLHNKIPEAASQTIANLYKITREDGMILRFTDHDSKLDDEENQTYYPQTGKATAKQFDATLRDDEFEIKGILTSGYITENDLHAGLYNEAEVVNKVVSWRLPWLGPINENTWYINRVEWMQSQGLWRGYLEGPHRKLRVLVGRKFNRNCDRVLGDSGCKVDVSGSFTYTGAVNTVTDRRTFTTTTSAITALAVDWLRYGVLTFTSGSNSGISVEVRSSTTGSPATIITQLEYPFDIAVSDTFTVTAGCDHTMGHCNGKYSNKNNFGGFNHMPGNDKLTLTPDDKS